MQRKDVTVMTATKQIDTCSNRKTIVCFGDSNTYGQRPDSSHRFGESERWTRLLQHRVADLAYVIEEGLGGRTIDREDRNPDKPTRNGWTYFKPCIQSHRPDAVIITLGTNDCQISHAKSAADIAESLQKYIDFLRSEGVGDILLVAPSPLDGDRLIDAATGISDRGTFDYDSVAKSVAYIDTLRALAATNRVDYVDAGDYVQVGQDGLHWDKDSQTRFADAAALWVGSITGGAPL